MMAEIDEPRIAVDDELPVLIDTTGQQHGSAQAHPVL